jgi:predicted nucleotidyltransferase
MEALAAADVVERAARALIDAASSPARVILFGSRARGDADQGSDFDFLVIEREVEDRLTESVKLRRALRNLRVPVDVIVMDEALEQRRAKVKARWSIAHCARARCRRVLSSLSMHRCCFAGQGADLRACRVLVDEVDIDDSVVGFHGQQCAEKALKAALVLADVEIPRTHARPRATRRAVE